MSKFFAEETWKTVEFDFEYTNEGTIEVSNLGRIRTFNKLSNGNIISGSMINGYRILRLKLYKPRDEKKELQLQTMQKQMEKFAKEVREMKQNLKFNTDATAQGNYESAYQLLTGIRKNLSKKYADDLKERTINYHSLIHRLVATYFCDRHSEEQTIVAHVDFNKLNNNSSNLVWMTPAENHIHQQKSPYVIAEKSERKENLGRQSKVAKLTITRVMLLKKLLNEGKPMRTLVKQFKITETQIRRIKKGENWGFVEAAYSR